jgi:choline dehydrogenase
MSDEFDFVIVGGGSAGAVIASRLSEDRSCKVALIEAGERPPEISSLPNSAGGVQLNPAADWMYTADPGKAGLGLNGRRIPVPRRCRAERCSAARPVSTTWSMCAAIRATSTPGPKAAPPGGVTTRCCPISARARASRPTTRSPSTGRRTIPPAPLSVSVRDPILPAARQYVEAAVAAGIPRGDYNGRDRGGPAGMVSLSQTTTRHGNRSSTYQAFLAGEPEQRPNLTLITGAHEPRDPGRPARATERHGRRVPHRLRRDGDRSRRQGSHLERGCCRLTLIAAAVRDRATAGAGHRRRPLSRRLAACRQKSERSLADPSVLCGTRGRCADERSSAVDGTRRIARPSGRLSVDPADDATLSPELQALKQEAERRFTKWQTTGRGLGSSWLADAVVFCSTGLGDLHSHDTEIMLFVTGGNDDFLRVNLNIDTVR